MCKFVPLTTEQLTQLSDSWAYIGHKLVEMAQLGAFESLDTDKYYICGVKSYSVSDNGKRLNVSLSLYEYGYGNEIKTFDCPIELFFMDSDAIRAYVLKRREEYERISKEAVAKARREERHRQYLELKAEFEPEAANGSC